MFRVFARNLKYTSNRSRPLSIAAHEMSFEDFDPFARWREASAPHRPERAPGRFANTERLASRPAVLVVRDMLASAGSSLAEVETHSSALTMLIARRHCALAAERAGQLRHGLRYAEKQLELAFLRAEADAPQLVEYIARFHRRLEEGSPQYFELLDEAPTPAEEANPAAWHVRLARLDVERVSEPASSEPMGELIDATALFRPRGAQR